ncbi:MAG: hypothetical protein ACLFRY_15615, partial [Spirochaetia bacterium]
DIELITDIFRRAAVGSGGTRDRAVEEGISLMETSGSIAAARKRALEMLEEAEAAFQTVFSAGTGRSSEARECLLSMISAFKRSG